MSISRRLPNPGLPTLAAGMLMSTVQAPAPGYCADATEPAPVQITRAYGPDRAQTLDIYIAGPNSTSTTGTNTASATTGGTISELTSKPATKPSSKPILLAVHGGAWSGGDKEDKAFGRERAAYFVKLGFVYVSINYRLAPANKHPKQLQDLEHALTYVLKHSAEVGGDKTRINLLGHSAGGHLAALLAASLYKHGSPELHSIKSLILLDPAALDLSQTYQKADRNDRAILKAVFTDDPSRLSSASPLEILRRLNSSSPNGNAALSVLICLSSDWLLKKDKALQFLSACQRARLADHGQVVMMEERNHNTLIERLGEPGEKLTTVLIRFLSNADGSKSGNKTESALTRMK